MSWPQCVLTGIMLIPWKIVISQVSLPWYFSVPRGDAFMYVIPMPSVAVK